MTDNLQEAEEINEEEIETPDEEVLDSQEEDQDEPSGEEKPDDAEDRARKMGWKPQEEYQGKDEWVDAETFLSRSENDPAELKKSLRAMERNFSKLEKNTEAIIAHQSREVEEAQKRAYAQALRDVESRLSQAVEDGDQEGINKAIKARDQIKEAQAQPTKQPNNADQAAVEEWKADNPWFDEDPYLADYAGKYEESLARKGVPIKERLEKTTEYMKKRFPEDLGVRKPKEGARMPGGGNNFRKNTTPKPGTYEALLPEAKAECDRSVKGSGGQITKEDWLQYATPDMFRSQK